MNEQPHELTLYKESPSLGSPVSNRGMPWDPGCKYLRVKDGPFPSPKACPAGLRAAATYLPAARFLVCFTIQQYLTHGLGRRRRKVI